MYSRHGFAASSRFAWPNPRGASDTIKRSEWVAPQTNLHTVISLHCSVRWYVASVESRLIVMYSVSGTPV